jgi:hypothetical protein
MGLFGTVLALKMQIQICGSKVVLVSHNGAE